MRALDALEPDIVLVEGPPDADSIVPLAVHEAMQPPVAILVYAVDEPRRAGFYPFASFSPEWQALRWALTRGVPVRFMDLPQANRTVPDAEPDAPEPRPDPLDAIAAAAGFTDGERWWDRMVERRRNDADAFAAVAELMTGLRTAAGERDDPEERLREAAMRRIVRAAAREHEKVAVVCGAWHVPALASMPPASADLELLRGLPKTRVAATWIPWTFGRLTSASGYGAGIESPGWYEHLWERRDEDVVSAWMTKAARCFRQAEIDVSPAHAIEAARLADALAALRAAPLAGLHESLDAIRAVYCFGDATPMRLLAERLVVGERLGAVPDDVPQVPLPADVAREQRRLRLPPDVSVRELDLDLRKPGDLDRSRLLHRLAILGVPWGAVRDVHGKSGTFHELWTLRWQPEFALTLIEASRHGNTLYDAAAAFVHGRAQQAQELTEVTALLDATFAAALGDAASFVLARLGELAAQTRDAGLMLAALPALVRTRRYGDVRGTDVGQVAETIDALLARVCVGLPSAVLALDDEAAATMEARIGAADDALRVLDDAAQRERWYATLKRIAASDRVHGLVAGRTMRLLFDAGSAGADDLLTRLARALSRGTPPAEAAAWLEGLLRGSALLVVHHPQLLAVVDRWLTSLDAEAFLAVLPLVRRAFAAFSAPERRTIAEVLAPGTGAPRTVSGDEAEIDVERARLVLPVLRAVFGRPS